MQDSIRPKEIPVYVEDEIKASYLDYSMSVIVSRALPDVRDGLKPVHRRILFAMNELGMTSDKPHKKSARIVGEVLGKYHPHGDTAVYFAMVRLAQEFNTRYTLIDGHGNFGSIDGDSAAAMRYTEARMAKITEELLEDISKDTIDFRKNFDESLDEPVVLPAKLPNLLLNGATGIAVGMATNIPPHNLAELCDGIVALIDNKEISVDELIQYIPGPDFPTGGIINGRTGIYDAYRTGRGKLNVLARTEIETNKQGKSSIIVTEIPYQVNKAKLIERIADLVKLKKLTGITDIRDESSREGLRIVIEVRKGDEPEIVLNHLYKYTDLQTTYGVIMLALVNNVPKVLNLKQVLENYLKHRFEVVERRTRFELDKAKKRAHILEGFRIALDSIDEIISIIRSSSDANVARENLIKQFGFTEIQARAILDMKLQRLTGLERDKIEQEYAELLALISELNSILVNDDKKYEIIKQEVITLKTKFGDKRRTEIANERTDIDIEDLIKEEDVVVTITNKGYVKRVPADQYKTQKRGGIGVNSTNTVEDDEVKDIYTVRSLDSLIAFTDKGKSYKLKVYEIPEASKQARGKLINNIINISQDEKVNTLLNVGDSKDDEDKEVFLLTKYGVAKKTKVSLFKNMNKAGLKAINLKEDDNLVFVSLTSNNDENIFIATRNGMAIRVSEKDFRSMGRSASGVRAIKLKNDDEVVSASIIPNYIKDSELFVLTITDEGFGKKTKLKEYKLQSRSGVGLKNIKLTSKNGNVVSSMVVSKDDETIMLITKDGTLIKTLLSSIPNYGRASSGVIIMKPRENDFVKSVALYNVGDEENE